MSHPLPPSRAAARARSTGLDLTVVLSVVLPVLTLVAIHLVRTTAAPEVEAGPSVADLVSSYVVCPSALGTGGGVALTASAGEAGSLLLGAGADRTPAPVVPNEVTTADTGDAAVVVTGRAALAPGLVAGRSTLRPLAAVDCAPPTVEQWFTGVGAGATHRSVLELVNPNEGPAIADISVYSANGEQDVPVLRGVAVPGGSARRLDLATLAPRRGELALHVVTQRGRLSATVEDGNLAIGATRTVREWLPGQAGPALDQLLLGLPRGGGPRSLVLANPGDSEVRVEVSLVTDDSVFAPQGLDTVRVAPRSIARIELSDVLGEDSARDATGLQVRSSGAVTAALRSVVRDDLVATTAGERVSTETSVLLPVGDKRVVLAGALAAGTATLVARAADGTTLATRTVDLAPDRGSSVVVPPRTALLTLTPEGTSVVGSVLITGRTGVAVVRMRELVRQAEVPDVQPGPPS